MVLGRMALLLAAVHVTVNQPFDWTQYLPMLILAVVGLLGAATAFLRSHSTQTQANATDVKVARLEVAINGQLEARLQNIEARLAATEHPNLSVTTSAPLETPPSA